MSEQEIHDIWYGYAPTFVEKKNKSEQGWAVLSQVEQEIVACCNELGIVNFANKDAMFLWIRTFKFLLYSA
ncbi:hypothetical protein [Paenibacillus sp. TSA_86.1]|uniref:hypothetical protein n=1 Tax=Paenibacillus sp. TSA_86.1 TaxID=3415649 RepID=UPI00404533E8